MERFFFLKQADIWSHLHTHVQRATQKGFKGLKYTKKDLEKWMAKK